jgi:hypothetical protein
MHSPPMHKYIEHETCDNLTRCDPSLPVGASIDLPHNWSIPRPPMANQRRLERHCEAKLPVASALIRPSRVIKAAAPGSI